MTLTYVRYGSLADITAPSRHVRFTPDNGQPSVQVGCPLCANSGHYGSGCRRRPRPQGGVLVDEAQDLANTAAIDHPLNCSLLMQPQRQ
jgi:hypothetical protein